MTKNPSHESLAKTPQWKKIALRFLILLVVAGLQLLYLPLNKHLAGGVAPALRVDAAIPLWPMWVFPYVSAIPAWVAALFAATLWMDRRNFRIAMLSALVAISVGISMYALYPTYVIRPEIPASGLGTALLRSVYTGDQPYNALPSGHVYLTVLVALAFSHWKPRLAWLWWLLALVIAASTLFTKQHYLLDVISGGLLALLAHGLARLADGWLERRIRIQKTALHAP